MKIYWILFVVFFIFSGCQNLRQAQLSNPSEGNLLKEIQRVKSSTFRVYASASYDTYTFNTSENIRNHDLSNELLKSKTSVFNRTSSLGTATLILKNSKQQVLLTCFHIFNYPDTIRQFYYREDGSKTPYLSSVSIKKKQENFMKMGNANKPLELIAADTIKDLAFMKTVSQPKNPLPHILEFQSLKKIKDGSQAIICGYPSGYEMVTRATISKQKQTGRIILDASFNQGFSGAPYFVADESGKLMLAGMVTAAASTATNIIVPEFPKHKKQYNPNEPYEGNIFVETDEHIRYGITFTLNSEEIKDFYIENIHQFNNKGISLHRVFNIKDL